jgi:myosin-9
MRPDIVVLLRSSKNAFISGMIGIDPVAVFRWAVLRAFFRAMVAFREAGKRHIQKKTGKQWLLVFYHASVFIFLTSHPQGV